MAETFRIDTGALALTAVAKSVIEIIAGSTVTARLTAITFSFDGSASGNNAKCEILRATGTGTGTAYTPLRGNGEAQNRAALCTAKINDTVEPTGITIVTTTYVPLAAAYPYLWPLGRELYLPTSNIFAIRITPPVAITGAVNLEFEE